MSNIMIETEKTDYTGGEVVKGRCALHLDEAIPARGIRIKFHGYEHAHWSTGSGKNRRTYSETRHFFEDEETFFGQPPLSMTAVLADVVKGIFSKDQYEILQPGTYEYEFAYQLSPNLPGDFESGGASKIAYEITAYIDMPLKLDISTTNKLTIYETYDRGENKPISANNNKTFLLAADNPLDMSVAIDRNMAFPGEKVYGAIEVTNRSKKNINAITVSLNQIVELKAGRASTTHTSPTQLVKFENPSIPWGEPVKYDLDLTLPDDLYCTIETSQLVHVHYEFDFNLDVPWARDLNVKIPLTILEEAGMPAGVK